MEQKSLEKYLFQVRLLHRESTGSVLDFTVLNEVQCIVKNKLFSESPGYENYECK